MHVMTRRIALFLSFGVIGLQRVLAHVRDASLTSSLVEGKESGPMNKRIAMLLTFIVATAATTLLAYEDVRVIGRVTQVESSSLKVKTKEGKEISIATDQHTAYLRDQKKTEASELKAGQSVVVNAHGDNEDSLLASEVRIVLGSSKGK